MNFSHIDTRLSARDISSAKDIMGWLFTELAVRDDNYHVGTGLGGNNFQLLTLMNFKHHLVKRNIDIHYSDKSIAWSADWLYNTPKRSIRTKLDEIFPQIIEKNKVLSLALEALAKSSNLRQVVQDHKDHFPELYKSLDSKQYVYNDKLSALEQLIAACVLCQELSWHVDAGDMSYIPITARALKDFPPNILVYSIRHHIQIERLVKYNMDEDVEFGPLLQRVNNVVDV